MASLTKAMAKREPQEEDPVTPKAKRARLKCKTPADQYSWCSSSPTETAATPLDASKAAFCLLAVVFAWAGGRRSGMGVEPWGLGALAPGTSVPWCPVPTREEAAAKGLNAYR
eukprot:6672218-Pyramimonas_sp.AAC.1